MSAKTVWIVLVASLAGAAVGFILANSINRSELSNLLAENERLKSTTSTKSPGDANSDLTEEEINATIARADNNPGDFDMQRNVGVAIYRYGAMKQDEKLVRQAVKILERATKLRPDDYDVILSLGNAYFDVGYFGKDNESLSNARTFYAKAIAAKPDSPEIITDLGLTYFLQTPPDYDNAVTEFKKALAKNPKHEKALQFLVQTLIKQNKSSEASEYLEQLRVVNPKNQSIGELTSMLLAPQPAG
jgi:tetratricopeptide (TPR) repeat protein